MAFLALGHHWKILASAWPRWHSAKSMQPLCIPLHIKTKVYRNFCLDYWYFQKSAFSEDAMVNRASFLASLFKADEADMVHFLSQHKWLVTMGEAKFQDLSQLLARHGITKQQILMYPEVYRRRYETLATRIRQLEEVGIRPVNLRLINTTHKTYIAKHERLVLEAEASEEYGDTIHFLSQHAGLSLTEAKKILNEFPWLQKMRLSTLKERAKILQQYNIPSEALRERVRIFAYSAQTIKSRLETLKNSGTEFRDFPQSLLIGVSLPNDSFTKFQRRLLEEKSILQASNCKDKKQYLCYRLGCSQKEIDDMIKKLPNCHCPSLRKLKANLDLLLEDCKLAPSEILDTPHILIFSTATLKDRIKQWRFISCLLLPVLATALRFGVLLTLLEDIQQQQDEIYQLFCWPTIPFTTKASLLGNLQYPVTSGDLNGSEEMLGDEDVRRKMMSELQITYLASVGAKGKEDMARNILRKMMKGQLAVSFNMTGQERHGKSSFRKR